MTFQSVRTIIVYIFDPFVFIATVYEFYQLYELTTSY